MIFKSKKSLPPDSGNIESRLSIATQYLERISEGNFDLDFVNTLSSDISENKEFLDTLHRTHDRMIAYSKKDHERKWVAEGISKFIDLTSGDNKNKIDFYDRIIALLIKYTGSNQGGVFLLNDSDLSDPFLELSACYAYDKKKFINKRVEIGNGILGQCYLEKETTAITHLPKDYAKITSGLGEATPRFLLLVPLKYDQEVLGIIEIASFQKLESYKIEFVEKIAESIASAFLNIRSGKRADLLFEEAQKKAQLLQEKEETLRQNLEELVATQEEMQRNQNELNRQASLLNFILDNIPFPVFVKDELGRYSIVNKAEAKLFNLEHNSIIGKDDSHFVNNKEEWEVIKESDEKVLASDEPLELPLQNFTTTQGSSYVFKTTKVPFVNSVTGKKNILGVSIDLTEKLNLEKKLFQEKRISTNNTLINITGRQRMLSQKIGFYSEALVRGRKQHAGILRDAIELYEHSLQVIRYGGMPMGVTSESPLPELQEELIPSLEKIEKVWQLYKTASENLLYFSSLENHLKTDQHHSEAEKNIFIIEANGEVLLKLNNDLMLACIQLNQSIMIDSF